MGDETEVLAQAWRREPVDQRPGFLIRRVQQVHTALFTAETGPERITPMMYSVLAALDQNGAMDQTRLSKTVAIDKTNLADLLERLRERGLVTRRVPRADRRVRLAALTPAGRALVGEMDAPVARAHARTIAALDADEQALFVSFLQRIVAAAEAEDDTNSQLAASA